MYAIGERINGMFRSVGAAIREKNPQAIQELAKRQLAAGADALDVNVGPAAVDPLEAMEWLVKTIREVTDAPLAIDTTKPDVMRRGLEVAGPGSIINSTKGQQEQLDIFIPMAAELQASVIALTIDESGIPRDANGRSEIALRAVASAMEHGLEPDRLMVDAVILPANVAQPTAVQVLEAIRTVKLLSDPPPKTILGLSNVSQGTTQRPLINRTYLVMALACGLDAAILDVLDTEMMDAMITAELLLNRAVYCDDFLRAYRS
ncbi:MAG: dihydropteroate synthase [Armatimonadota bacterium]|jgi:5-methyltetrahydrofolate corrinoid/iron sulfur protein methyltransferase